jgi:hypothetical protein
VAKILLSAFLADARGKLGGAAVRLSRYGLGISSCPAHTVTYTLDQLLQRGMFGSLSGVWKTVAMQPNRYAWAQLANDNPIPDVFGNMIKLAGNSFFQMANRNLQTILESTILVAPGSWACNNPAAVTLAHDTGPPEELNITCSTNPLSSEAAVIFATPCMSPGRLTIGNRSRKLAIINPGTASPWDVLAEYTAKFGPPVPGQILFVQVHYVTRATGCAGIPQQNSLIW